ncbi:MAG: potassium transporter TrkA, partial [Arcobacteraceae bacterium]|nr:potassium transporter TrkA [Arcobacteraceae bacterium]
VLLKRLIQIDTAHNNYDIVYMHDNMLVDSKPHNFTFYKFDPTSFSKLNLIMSKVSHADALVIMSNKNDTLSVIHNIDQINPNLFYSVYNEWDLEFNNSHIQNYNGLDVLSNGLIEKLPNVPVVAQNIGLKQGEIMEVKIPFGSSYAYRYMGSISQKDWKIFAIYRNGILINVKPTVILKPNDVILIIGKPKVLIQVYTAISKSSGHFPMPFGKNIYVFIDLYLQSEDDALNALKKARFLTERMKNSRLIVKITRPTTVETISKLKDSISTIKNKTIEFDYHFEDPKNILYLDKKRFDIGMIVLTHTLLLDKHIMRYSVKLGVPIFKVGLENINKIKSAVVVLNNTTHYEQIAPILFDITSQLKYKIQVIDSDPIGDQDRENLIEHFDNLSKIFNKDIKIDTNNKNPMKKLKENKKQLQILPLQTGMFKNRLFSFFTTNSDLLSYDLRYLNQVLIPIIEQDKGED